MAMLNNVKIARAWDFVLASALLAVTTMLLSVAVPVIRFFSWIYSLTPYSWHDIRGRTVIITGASSGIGQYMAYEYAKKGAILVLAARRVQKLEETAAECRRRGAIHVAIVRTDVTKEEDCQHLVEVAAGRFGAIDVLVNNAGTAEAGFFEEYGAAEEFKGTLDTDFWGNTLTTFYALPYLKRSPIGQVLVTTSVASYTTFPKQIFYNAAKAGLTQFYDTLRVESPEVQITIAMPGFVHSELTQRGTTGGHIPSWWPMLGTVDAAKEIVDGALHKKHYVIVPQWYKTWLLYRILVPEYVDKSIQTFLLSNLAMKRKSA